MRSGLRPSASPTSPNCRSRSTSTTLWPASASATARLHEVSVLPVPPFGPSTQISAPLASPAPTLAPLRRATAFWSAKQRVRSRASAASSTMSSAPASNTCARSRSASPRRGPRPAGRAVARGARRSAQGPSEYPAHATSSRSARVLARAHAALVGSSTTPTTGPSSEEAPVDRSRVDAASSATRARIGPAHRLPPNDLQI